MKINETTSNGDSENVYSNSTDEKELVQVRDNYSGPEKIIEYLKVSAKKVVQLY